MACSPLASALLLSHMLQADGLAVPQFTLSLAQAHQGKRNLTAEEGWWVN